MNFIGKVFYQNNYGRVFVCVVTDQDDTYIECEKLLDENDQQEWTHNPDSDNIIKYPKYSGTGVYYEIKNFLSGWMRLMRADLSSLK